MTTSKLLDAVSEYLQEKKHLWSYKSEYSQKFEYKTNVFHISVNVYRGQHHASVYPFKWNVDEYAPDFDTILGVINLDADNIFHDGKAIVIGATFDNPQDFEVFVLHLPNKVQRLHDEEWATIGRKGQVDFSRLSLTTITEEINSHSTRFEDYTFFSPEGIDKLTL